VHRCAEKQTKGEKKIDSTFHPFAEGTPTQDRLLPILVRMVSLSTQLTAPSLTSISLRVSDLRGAFEAFPVRKASRPHTVLALFRVARGLIALCRRNSLTETISCTHTYMHTTSKQ
jgi:hypothetical protein